MNRPEYCYCYKCGDDVHGDAKLYDLNNIGIGMVCEDCFMAYVEDCNLLSEDIITSNSPTTLADLLDIEHTTVTEYLDNEYSLMLEAKEEARRDMDR